MFAEFILAKEYNKTCLEFGATNGLEYSNTFSIEKYLNWTGVLAEPDAQWHKDLKKNRPNTKLIYDCVWTKSDEKLNFISSSEGVYSTIDKFKLSDKHSMPGNSKKRLGKYEYNSSEFNFFK